MKCRKCGTSNDAGAWVCKRCEYILDTSFLGNDILNERTRDSIDDDDSASAEASKENELGGDALILGSLDDEEVASFVSDRTGTLMPVSHSKAPAQVYLTGEISRLLLPDRVLRHTADADDRREVLSHFELAIFDLFDGVRALAEVQDLAGVSDNELCVTAALLYEKRLIEAAPLPSVAEVDDRTSPLDLPLDDAVPGPKNIPPLPFDDDDDARSKVPTAPARKPASKSPPPLPRTAAATAQSAQTAEKPPKPRPVTMPARESSKKLAKAPPAPPVDLPLEEPPPQEDAPLEVRPALRPAMKTAGPPAAAPKPKPKGMQVLAPSPSAPADVKAQPTASNEAMKRRALGYYDACMKELKLGRAGRAWGYAKMAADCDPAEEKYAALLRDWAKLGGAHGDRASTPQELMAAAQEADSGGDTAKAVDLLRKLIEQSPSSAAAYNYLAVLLATKQKQFRPAYDAAIKAVELDPGNVAYQSNMMKILARVDSDEKRAKGSDDGKGLLGRLLRR